LKRVGLLREYVKRHNAGVRTGRFGPLLELFAEHAEMRFEGLPVGPFVGRERIADAFRNQPPDDELVVRQVQHSKDTEYAVYAWKRRHQEAAGVLEVTTEAERIVRVVVNVESPPARQ
jgi:steroid delta-isomerase